MSDPREPAFHEPFDGQNPEAADDPAAEQERALGEPTAISVASMAAEIAELKAELGTLKDETEKRLIGWQRSQADLENYKKHSIQDLADRVRLAKAGVLLDLLVVVDDFERALAADHETDAQAWIEGVRLIERKFYAFLEAKDLAPIAAEQQRFDPNFHEALGQAPGPAGQVIAQLQKGYLLGERVLRPARVIVGSGDEADASTATAEANAAAPSGDQDTPDASPADASESR